MRPVSVKSNAVDYAARHVEAHPPQNVTGAHAAIDQSFQTPRLSRADDSPPVHRALSALLAGISRVLHVALMRHAFQIERSVVRLAQVFVIDFAVLRSTRCQKSICDKMVNESAHPEWRIAENDIAIAVTVQPELENAPRPGAARALNPPNLAAIRNFVGRMIFNWPPCFPHAVNFNTRRSLFLCAT